MVACTDCQHFIPDQVGDGLGVGQCKKYQDYLAKNPSEHALHSALRVLDNKTASPIFWGGTLKDRQCERFKQL